MRGSMAMGLASLALVGACGPVEEARGSGPALTSLTGIGTGGDDGGDDGSADGGDDGSADGGGDGADEDSGGDVKFDLPSGEGGDPPPIEEGCKKVDFVFVIDSSPSMGDEQDNLLASGPGFIQEIEQTLMLDDFHLMVVDAGAVTAVGCTETIGAGHVYSATGQDCGIAGGNHYATQADADLTSAFTCMASRGFTGPSDERTMDALTASIGPLNAAGACNAGFVRPDALLVIVLITDEEDDPGGNAVAPLDGSCVSADADLNSAGDPVSWKSSVVNAKNGDEDAVVVLGLLADCDIGGVCPGIAATGNPAEPYTGAEPSPRLRQFVDSFPYGSLGPVCTPDYSPFFAEAVSVVDTACSNFEPPG